MTILAIAFLLVVAFGGGWKAHARKSIDYKKRWETATALYEQERLNTLGPMADMSSDNLKELRATITDAFKEGSRNKLMVLETQKNKPKNPKSSSLSQRQLWYMSDSKRWEIEKARLDNGFDPFDNLAGMGDNYAQKIVTYRIQKGFG